MYQIPLIQNPNQSLGVTLDGNEYIVQIKSNGDVLTATISINGVNAVNSVLCRPQQIVIPYPYLTKGGNFVWVCQDYEYPDYNKFGGLHNLFYLTDAELEALPT